MAQTAKVLARNSQQNVLGRTTIHVKWYSQDFLYPEGCHVYRKTDSSSWQRVNLVAIRLTPPAYPAAFATDSTLEAFVEMAKDFKNASADGLLLLNMFAKTFESHDYSKIIGIQYDDASVEWGKRYQYRVAKLEKGKEVELATSDPVTAGPYQQPDSVRKFSLFRNDSVVFMKWRPEEDRFYATHLYKRQEGVPSWQRITPRPVMQTETEGAPPSEAMFEDRDVAEGITYEYYITALDFFGNESIPSSPRHITLPDRTPPPRPEGLEKRVSNRSVTLTWKPANSTEITEQNVYMSPTSEGPFERVNELPLPPSANQFRWDAPRYGFYYFRIASQKKSGLEASSQVLGIEVQDTEPPLPPRLVRIQADTGRITVQWTPSLSTDVWGYHVWRSFDSEKTFALVNAEPLVGTDYTQVFPPNAKNSFSPALVGVPRLCWCCVRASEMAHQQTR